MENEKSKKKFFKRRFTDTYLATALLTVLLMILGQLLGQLIFLIPGTTSTDLGYAAASYGYFIGIWIVTLLYMAVTKKNRPIFKCLWIKEKGNNIWLLLLGIFIGFASNALCILVAYLNKDISLSYDSFNLFSFVFLFIMVFIQSSAEELLCRGFMYQRLRKSYKHPAVAIVGNAVLFAALHLLNDGVTALSILNIIVVGIQFSLMVYYMDSIWCAMAAHAAWNFTQNFIFGLPNSGIPAVCSIFTLDAANARSSFAYDTGFGIEGTIVADIVLIVIDIIIFVWGHNKKKKEMSQVTA